MKALIVDDNRESREALARIIHAEWVRKIDIEKLEIIEADTLESGLLLADEASVTILDLNLPDSSPETTIDAIHRFRPPVIVLTGDEVGKSLASKCLEAGASHVYMKGSPFGLEVLLSSVFSAMRRDILRRHNLPQFMPDEHASTQ